MAEDTIYMASELSQAIQQVCDEKGIPVESVVESIESALAAAFRKDFGNKLQNLEVVFDIDTGTSKIFDIKEIVEDQLKIDTEEYIEAKKNGLGPRLFAGDKEKFCGKVALTEITGGTEGSAEVYDRLSAAGVGTIVGMHMSEKHTKAAKKAHVNALVAGHISSDSIGVNLFVDELVKRGVEVKAISGLTRVSRV